MFLPGEEWDLKLPGPNGGNQVARVVVLAEGAHGMQYRFAFDEAKKVQFISWAIPFMAERVREAVVVNT